MGIDLIALAGLAMNRATSEISDLEVIGKALDKCDKRIESWVAAQKRLAIDRPFFNGFSQGQTTDYIFLPPELLAAIFLVDRGDPPKARRFVLRVISDLNDNVVPKSNGGSGIQSRIKRGYCVQGDMVRTADQMWVVELLKRFQRLKQSDERTLLPSNAGWFTSRLFSLFVGIAAVSAVIVLNILENGWTSKSYLAIAIAIFLVLASFSFERAGGSNAAP